MIAATIYCGNDVDFGSGPCLFIDNLDEAFGTLECWAEGSLAMAENAAKRLGLAKPRRVILRKGRDRAFPSRGPRQGDPRRKAGQGKR